MERRGEALTTPGNSRQGGHHPGAQRQALPHDLLHGMWPRAAEEGREDDRDHHTRTGFSRLRPFFFFFLNRPQTKDQKDLYLGTGFSL